MGKQKQALDNILIVNAAQQQEYLNAHENSKYVEQNLQDGELDIQKYNIEIGKAIQEQKDDETKSQMIVSLCI